MPLSSPHSHIRTPSQSGSSSSTSSTRRLFDKLKGKRKQPLNATNEDENASTLGLAQRLRVLLDVHPVNSPAPSFQPLPTPDQSPVSSLSSPTTYYSAPLPASPADPELVALLSSPVFADGPSINGSPAHTPMASPPSMSPARRQNVFNILDRIGSPRARAKRLSRVVDEGSSPASPRSWPVSPAMSSISSVLAGSTSAAYGSDGMREIEEESADNADDDDDEDDTSIMMYSPLMPTLTSLVSIADSEEVVSVVAVHEEETDEEEAGQPGQVATTPPTAGDAQAPAQNETRSGWGLSNLWPFSSWFSSSSADTTNDSTQPGSAPSADVQTVQPGPVSPRQSQVRLRRRRVWVPSRTQLSLETMWWGYRIYIPPPVLEALDSTSIETSRRAALLTAALTWFFTNFPVNVLPPAVRPVIIILQGLVPYLGYLGGILSWSWGTIRRYDEGYGVILTATWLVPIALIPSTWVPPPFEWPGSPRSTTFSPTTSHPTPTLSTMSQSTSFTTLSPTTSQSTPTPVPLSPASLQSHSTPTAMFPPVSLPLQQVSVEQTQTQLQTQQPLYSSHSSSVYSPFSYASILSPLPQLFASTSFPSPTPPTQNTSDLPYPYAYTYGHGQPSSAVMQSSPVMAMSMTSPPVSTTNGTVVYSPTTPFVLPSPYAASVSISASASVTATPVPASFTPLSPSPSTASSRQRELRRRRDGTTTTTTYAPRLATVPLPEW